MLPLAAMATSGAGVRILLLGAHCDDIEIGCGGTILKLLSRHEQLEVDWVVFSSDAERESEARTSAAAFLTSAKRQNVVIENFRDGFFPYIGADIKDYFELLKRELEPDVIFTHCRTDRHQDHRVISDLTWNTFRNHLILEYEVPKYDGDLGRPNCYVSFGEEICRQKLDVILDAFKSQCGKQWFAEETFRGLMRLRGVESGAASQYAEAFYARKFVLDGVSAGQGSGEQRSRQHRLQTDVHAYRT